MKKHRFPILILLAAIGIVIAVEVLAPRPPDWTTTYAMDDKNPFGSKVLYDLLGDLFPGQPVEVSYQTLYERKDSLQKGNYIYIGNSFDPGEEDINLLLKLVSEGSCAFIAAGQLGEGLEDTLNCSTRSFFSLSDSVSAQLSNPKLASGKPFQFRKIGAVFGFLAPDSTHKHKYEILGTNQVDDPNFVKIKWGKGWFYLQCLPQAYTNYNMLEGRNIAYIERTLSYLPVQPVYWDELQKDNNRDLQTPLRFLILNPPLRWALYLTMAALLLFMFFEAKRRQRIIPVIRPLANTTLEFTRTVGRLYYQQRDHKNIADKKITFFLDYIRSTYFVRTQDFNEELYERLHSKTGIAREEIVDLFNLIRQIRSRDTITENQLLRLNEKIENFTAISLAGYQR